MKINSVFFEETASDLSVGTTRNVSNTRAKKAGIEPWAPNRLRHAAVTQIRKLHGLEAAQVVAGIEANPIAKPLIDFISTVREFSGNAKQCLDALNSNVDEATQLVQQQANSGWPKTPRAVSGRLRRIAPNLRQMGVEVELGLPGRGIWL